MEPPRINGEPSWPRGVGALDLHNELAMTSSWKEGGRGSLCTVDVHEEVQQRRRTDRSRGAEQRWEE